MSPTPPPAAGLADGPVELLNYDIVYDSIEDPTLELPRVEELLGGEPGAHERLLEQVHEHPRAAIPILNRLHEQLPNSRLVMNWLSTAYSISGDMADAQRIAVLNYERNPDYLFARLNYAQFCLRDGKLDEIPIIFGDKFDLKLLYPHRNAFHISEFVAFSSVMIEYFMRTGNEEQAELRYELLDRIAPDEPAITRLGELLTMSLLLRTVRKLLDIPRRRKRIRSASAAPPSQPDSKLGA